LENVNDILVLTFPSNSPPEVIQTKYPGFKRKFALYKFLKDFQSQKKVWQGNPC